MIFLMVFCNGSSVDLDFFSRGWTTWELPPMVGVLLGFSYGSKKEPRNTYSLQAQLSNFFVGFPTKKY